MSEPFPSIKELRAICQKSAPNPARESVVGRFARIFSIYCTRLFIATPITPNQITCMSVLVFFSGMLFFLASQMEYHLIGSALIFFSIVLDGADGEVARFRTHRGINGGVAGTLYVEPVSHDVQYGLMFLPIGVGLVMHGAPWYYAFLGGVAGITKLLYRLLEIRMWTLTNYRISAHELEAKKNEYQTLPRHVRLFYFINKNFFSSTGVFLTILIAALLGRMDWYLWFYAAGFTILWLLLFLKQTYRLSKGAPLPPTKEYG